MVLLFLTPTSNIGAPSPKALSTDSTPESSGNSSFNPYLTSPTSFPTPEDLPNVTGNVTLPQISNITVGGTFFYILLFVDQIPELGDVLDFDTGTYDPALAQSIARTDCTANCANDVPILWNGATAIAAYANAPIQSDTLLVTDPSYVGQQLILAGASSNNTTMVYVSADNGDLGSWRAVTSQGPLPGGNPQIDVAVDRCALTVVTHVANGTFVWSDQRCFTYNLLLAGPRSPAGPTANGVAPDVRVRAQTSDPPSEGPTQVTGVIPQLAMPGQTLDVLGTNLTSIAAVRVGNVAAAVTSWSATNLSVVMPPNATGYVNVQVLSGGSWSAAACANQLSLGTGFISGTPEIFGLSQNVSTVGTNITITGTNFTSSDSAYFGSVTVKPANLTFVNSTTYYAKVPNGTGTVAVELSTEIEYQHVYYYVSSPTTCADVFHYGSVYLYSVSPPTGEPPLTLVLSGVGFSTNAKVHIGSKAVATTYVSPTELEAAVPSGKGTVQVDVQQGGVTTDAVPFHYASAIPSVIGLAPNRGPIGTTVTVYGANFTSSSIVHFASKNATTVSYVAQGELTAVAPKSSGTVNVTVHVGTVSSRTVCSDLYSYGSAYASGLPEIASIFPSTGESGANVTIHGVNLSTSDTVLFGGVPAPATSTRFSNSTTLIVEAPLGMGTVPVQIEKPKGASPLTCSDEFEIASAGSLVNSLGMTQASEDELPATTSAVPITLSQPVMPHPESWFFVGGFYGVVAYADYSTYIFATNGSKLSVWWEPIDAYWAETNLTQLNTSLGSALFDEIGDTARSIPGGITGQLALLRDGAGAFLLATADANGRTDLETLVTQSANVTQVISGTNNCPPDIGFSDYCPAFNFSAYLTTPVVGSASDPQLAQAPYEGYYYATWLENGGGPEQIDEAVFTSAGVLVQAPGIVAGSGGGSADGNAAANEDLVVDPMGQPIVVWDWASGPKASQIAYTGQYLFPTVVIGYLEQAWSNLPPADFTRFGGNVYNATVARILVTMNNVTTDVTVHDLCGAYQNASSVYTNDTWNENFPIVAGPPIPKCAVPTPNGFNTELVDGTGVLSASFFMGVETEWLFQSLGMGTMPLPDWSSVNTLLPPSGKPYLPDTSDTLEIDGQTIEVAPVTSNDTTLWLDSNGIFHTVTSTTTLYASGPLRKVCGTIQYQDSPIDFSELATIQDRHGSAHGTFTNSTTVPSPLFYHIYPNLNGTWWSNVTVTFQTIETVSNQGCPPGDPQNGSRVVTPPSGMPGVLEFNLSGNFTTGLDPHPFTIPFVGTPNGPGPDATRSYSVHWENTVNATAQLWLNGTCETRDGCNASWSNPIPATNDTASGGNLSSASNLLGSIFFDIRSTNTSQGNLPWPKVNAKQVSVVMPAQLNAVSCKLNSAQNATLNFTAGREVTNLTSSSATFNWYSNQPSDRTYGWAEIQMANETPITVTAQSLTFHKGSKFVAQASGLEAWQVYSVRFFVLLSTACMAGKSTVADLSTTWSLPGGEVQVPGNPLMFEQDEPYDSVTHQGGGAIVAWQIPFKFENQPNTTFENGTLTLTAPSNTSLSPVVFPISAPLVPFTNYSEFGVNVENGSASTFALNLTGLVLNTTYDAVIVLNYSTAATKYFQATNSITFTYEKDTTGDGLTDWEKDYGWYVITTGLSGATTVDHVKAVVGDYATNGLVSDFVEKEYGLNPTTVDSANSGMLDTWNLTFNLGAGGGVVPLPGFFNIWGESNTYHPFANGLEYSPGLFETGNPVADNITNVSASGTHGITSGDGSPWAARALWSYSALETFVNLPGVERAASHDGGLEAVEGSWDGIETFTVEGKLSWGANPLAASTPGNGVPDGVRLNPLGGTDLQVTVDSFGVSSGLTTGDGVAAYINAYSEPAPYYESNISDYSGFTSQVNAANEAATYSGNFVVTFPVTPTELNVDLNLSVMVNISTNSTPNPYRVLSTPIYSIDLAASGAATSASNSNASLSFSWQVLPIYSKASTWLLAPSNNTTLSPLPLGLSRYSAEQDFDVLVVNDTGTNPMAISQTVDGPQLDWTYTVTLQPGLNNILVPRDQFLSSPLGNALANATAVNLPGVHEDGSLSYHAGDWLGRVTGTGSGSAPGSANYISVYSTVSQSCSSGNAWLCGGVPSNPTFEAGSEALQVQGVFWINVSSSGDGQNLSTGNAVLADLLGGLLLNAAGNLTGNLIDITTEIPTLALSSNILTALANSSVPNDGAYGVPASFAKPTPPPPPSKPWWDVAASDIWNSVSGAINDLVAVVSHVISVVWNGVTAAAAYLADAAAALSEKLGITALVSQAASALRAIGHAMWDALQALLNFVEQAVLALLKPVIDPIKALFTSWGNSVVAAFLSANATVHAEEKGLDGPTNGGTPSNSQILAFWQNLTGSPVFLGIIAFSTVVLIVLVLVGELDLGEAFLVNILISLVVAAVLAEASKLVPLTSALSGFGYSLESACHTFMVGLVGANDSWNWFQTMGELFVIPADAFDVVIGLILLAGAYFLNKAVIGSYAADLILSLVGLILDTLAAIAYSAKDYVAAFVESFLSVIFGAKSIYDLIDGPSAKSASKSLQGLEDFEMLSEVLGTATELTGALELGATMGAASEA